MARKNWNTMRARWRLRLVGVVGKRFRNIGEVSTPACGIGSRLAVAHEVDLCLDALVFVGRVLERRVDVVDPRRIRVYDRVTARSGSR